MPNTKKTKKFNIASLIIGIYLGAMIGSYMGEAITRYFEGTIFLIIATSIGVIIGGYLGTRYSIATEWIAFGFPILIFFQFWWDFGAKDLNAWRWSVFVAGLGLFILNMFTGRVKVNGAGKVLRRQLGLK